MSDIAIRGHSIRVAARPRSRTREFFQQKIDGRFPVHAAADLLIAIFVIYPAFYSVYLAMLSKRMDRFVGFSNFSFLFTRETFWMVVKQSCIFAITAVIFKAILGFIVAHLVHAIPTQGQRKWRGMLLVPWVIPPALSTLAWLWLFDPSYSAFNYIIVRARRGSDPRGPATRCGRAPR